MPTKSSGSVQIFYPEFDREHLIQRVSQRLADLEEKLGLKLLALFGSYARGNYTVASDIDLLVVYEGPEREDAYALIRRAVGFRGLEPHVNSLSQYKQMKETIDRMVQGGFVRLDKR